MFKLTFGNIDFVGDRFVMLSSLVLSVIAFSGPIFERTGKAGVFGSSKEDVRKCVLNNIIKVFQKW